MSNWKYYDMGRVWRVTHYARAEFKRVVANRCAAEFMWGSWWIFLGIALQVLFHFKPEWIPGGFRAAIYTLLWVSILFLIAPLTNEKMGEAIRGFKKPPKEELKAYLEAKFKALRWLITGCAVLLGSAPFLDPGLPDGGGERPMIFFIVITTGYTTLVHVRSLARWIISTVSEETSNELDLFEKTDAPTGSTQAQEELFHVRYENKNLTRRR